MKRQDKSLFIFVLCSLIMFCGAFPLVLAAQEINGELILHVPFEDETYEPEDWYLVQNNGNTAELLGMIEDGPDGGFAMVIYTFTFPDVGMNNIQYTNESISLPEGADVYPWRVTFWIQVKTAPFTIRPIMAMSEDPWSGTSAEYTIENAGEWVFIDLIIEAESNLTTDPLLLIFHMGNPGDEYDENEVWLDDLKLYLLNQETSIDDWSIY
jgi:hypothetical protein